MRFLLALILIFTSFMGYSQKIKTVFKINTSFIPFMLISSYIFIITLAARLSLMLFSVLVVNIVGVYFFIIGMKDKEVYNKLFPEYFLFFISVIILILFLYKRKLFMYDDFSHWGIISRLLLQKNAINTSLDNTVYYKSYPQATAYFIYGITKFLGYTEGNMMIANSLITLSGAFTFLSISKKKLANYFLSFIIIIFSFMYNIRPYSLLVDTILSTSSFAIFAFVYSNDLSSSNKYLKIFLIPMFVSLVYTKNSGLFLSIFLLFYIIKKYIRKDNKLIVISFLSIILANISWSNHIKNEFVNTGKHSMSLSSYKQGLIGNHDAINEFTRNFLNKVLTDKIMLSLILILFLYILLEKDRKVFVNLLLTSLIVYIVYQVGNYFMFITSMSVSELKRMASFDRYTRTIQMILVLINLYVTNDYIGSKKYCKFISYLLLLFSLIFIDPPEEIGNQDTTFRDNLYEIKQEKNIEKSKKILIKYKEYDMTRYITRMTMYEFETTEVQDTFPGDEKQFNKNDYDYFIDLSK